MLRKTCQDRAHASKTETTEMPETEGNVRSRDHASCSNQLMNVNHVLTHTPQKLDSYQDLRSTVFAAMSCDALSAKFISTGSDTGAE